MIVRRRIIIAGMERGGRVQLFATYNTENGKGTFDQPSIKGENEFRKKEKGIPVGGKEEGSEVSHEVNQKKSTSFRQRGKKRTCWTIIHATEKEINCLLRIVMGEEGTRREKCESGEKSGGGEGIV